MKLKALHIVNNSIRIFLMVFWLYVALDKVWELADFHYALVRQPFPDHWADTLFWLLPLLEMGISLLFLFFRTTRHLVYNPFLLSAVLLLVFSSYISLDLLGYYAEIPCGCASILSSLSWGWHLVVNIGLLALSLTGWVLNKSKPNIAKSGVYKKKALQLFFRYKVLCSSSPYVFIFPRFKRFKMRFAVFPGQAGIYLNYDT